MERKNKVLIKINGQEYPIVGAEPKEYLLKVGSFVDEKMEAVARGNKILSTSMVAVLTSINIADQYLKLKDAYTRLEAQHAAPLHELEQLKSAYEEVVELAKQQDFTIRQLQQEQETLKLNQGNPAERESLLAQLSQKEADLKKAEKMISDLQNKLFESQIKLVETRRQMKEILDYSEDDPGRPPSE